MFATLANPGYAELEYLWPDNFPKQTQKTIEETRQHLGATSLSFLSINGMVKATGLPKKRFSLSAFNGEYPLSIFEHKKEIKYNK